MDGEKIKILIVDDSKVTRDLIKHLLSINPNVEIIGTAENGLEALSIMEKNRPDILLTDIVMPKMDGFELTKKIMATNPMPVIVMSGVYSKDEIKRTFDVIDAGAVAILEKPKGIADEHFAETAKFIFDTAKLLSSIRGLCKPQTTENVSDRKLSTSLKKRLEVKDKPGFQIKSIAIGSSVGGPKALQSILVALPKSIQAPVFIVQHISPGFVQGFADWLKESISLEVSIAKNDEVALSGHVYIAPDYFDMQVNLNGVIKLTEEKEGKLYVPSVSSLFDSIAKSYGSNALGVLLLGAEKDGYQNFLEIKKRGGFIVQESNSRIKTSNESSDSVDSIAPIDEISRILKELVIY